MTTAPAPTGAPRTGTTPTGDPATVPVLPRTGAVLGVVLALLAAAALVTLLLVAPDGLRASADPGAPTVPYAHLLLPTLVALTAARLLPPAVSPLPQVRDRSRVVATVLVALLCVTAFTVVVARTGLGGRAEYHLVKTGLLVLLPGLAVLATRGSLAPARPRGAWRWWAPAVVVVLWTALAQAAPWLHHADYSAYPTDLLVAAATATALTAGVGEELVFRVWLQSRLEGLLGRWPGIAAATFAFALLHVGSRHGQGPLVEVAGAVVVQGLGMGLVAGYLWSRYRNVALTVALHVLANGFVVAVTLLA